MYVRSGEAVDVKAGLANVGGGQGINPSPLEMAGEGSGDGKDVNPQPLNIKEEQGVRERKEPKAVPVSSVGKC